MKTKSLPVIIGIFLIGLTLFMYQITLTRLFSTILSYHFVFMVISLSMLGLTLGGVYAFKWFKNQNELADTLLGRKKLSVLSLLSLALLITIIFLYKIPFHPFNIPIYLFLSTLPFIFGGYYLSLAFKEWVNKSNILYFADLIGSAIGAILIVLLLNHFSILRVGFILSLIPLFVLTFNIENKSRKIAGIVVSLSIISLLVTQGTIIDNWSKDFGAFKGSPKMLASLSEDKPRIAYTFWNSLARTDVVETDLDQDKIILVDGGAASRMIPFNGDLDSVEYLKGNLGYFPFSYKENKSALLIGPGGGRDILLAKLAGIESITAVELNPGSLMAAEAFKEFNGNIYGTDNVTTYIDDGRSFISSDSNKYDVIFLALVMTQASETLGYALSENYIYTKEAYETYLNHLNPGGTLAFVLHGENDLYKATTTILKIFEEKGIPREDAVKYITVVNSPSTHGTTSDHTLHVMYPLLMVKNTPFEKVESEEIIGLALNAEAKILSLPNFHEKLLDFTPPKNMEGSYLVTDNYPFFYNQGRTAPFLVIFMLIVTLLLGRYLTRKSLITKNEDVTYFKTYYSYIGLGFMLIEIPLIQKLILLFGHPTLTFSVVIPILLLAAGLGSLSSKIITTKVTMRTIGIIIFVYTGILFVYLPRFIDTFQGADLSLKILATFLLLLPLGLFMGIPFPSGLKIMKDRGITDYVPLMWGINGWMSVVGSILSLVLAMSLGYNITLLVGASLYLLFAFHNRKIRAFLEDKHS
ncbi:MAG: hypothetical protein APF84_01075 [Gracilibacter sp. BRH_c7a]|nr:MAG: hypothetical protein APF84_01075 [Gracilibacter sp. BRH_c7a]